MSLSSYFLYLEKEITDVEQAQEYLGACGEQISLAVNAFFCGMRNAANREMADLYFRAPPYFKRRPIKDTCMRHVDRLMEEGICSDQFMRQLLTSSAYPVTNHKATSVPLMPTGMPWEMLPLHFALHTAVINCVCNPDPGFIALSQSLDDEDIHLSVRILTGNMLPMMVYSKALNRLVYIKVQVHDDYDDLPPLFHDERCVKDIVNPTIIGITPTQ